MCRKVRVTGSTGTGGVQGRAWISEDCGRIGPIEQEVEDGTEDGTQMP